MYALATMKAITAVYDKGEVRLPAGSDLPKYEQPVEVVLVFPEGADAASVAAPWDWDSRSGVKVYLDSELAAVRQGGGEPMAEETL